MPVIQPDALSANCCSPTAGYCQSVGQLRCRRRQENGHLFIACGVVDQRVFLCFAVVDVLRCDNRALCARQSTSVESALSVCTTWLDATGNKC